MEDKEEIIERLKLLLMVTRAGRDIADLVLDDRQETITIVFENGTGKRVDIAADSGLAIIKDVVTRL